MTIFNILFLKQKWRGKKLKKILKKNLIPMVDVFFVNTIAENIIIILN